MTSASAQSKIPISEIFGPTIQGEGTFAGARTMFIRTAYCDGAGDKGWCHWCDSMYAVDPQNKSEWEFLTTEEIMTRLRHKSLGNCHNVTISGGNPVLHDLTELMKALRDSGWHVNVETQGTIWRNWLTRAETVTVSPKPPSAGSKLNHERLDNVLAQLSTGRTVLKVVVHRYNSLDYEFARDIFIRYGRFMKHLYISVHTDPYDTPEDILLHWRYLADKVTNDPTMPDVCVLPQLHVLLYGHGRGV